MRRILSKIKRFLFPPPPPQLHGWFGNYSSWAKASEQCTGYDTNLILEKVKTAVLKVRNGEGAFERDSVVFYQHEHCPSITNAFSNISKEYKGRLHVVDFGGSLGSTYFRYKDLFQGLSDLKWSVVEQEHFVNCGNEISKGIPRFFHNVNEALEQQEPMVLLLFSVLPYLENPYTMLTELLKYKFDYILVDRTAFIEDNKDRLTVQVVPEIVYKASYPAWFFNKEKFLEKIKTDYEMIEQFDSGQANPVVLEDGKKGYWDGFIFKRKKQ